MADPNAINQALTDNPKIIHSPGLATPVLTSQNPQSDAATLAHAYTVTTTQQALQDHAAQGSNQSFWQHTFGGAAKAVMGSLTWLNKPLQEVQRDYKYIHSVYTKHGIFQGLTATAFVAGGGILGSMVMPGVGTAVGADLAATAERKLFGHTFQPDSYADSENPDYKVSMGRDFSNALGQIPGLQSLKNTNTGAGKIVSGIGDMAFDFTADPFVNALKVRTAVKTGEFLTKGLIAESGAFRDAFPGVQNFLERNSLHITSADQVESLWQAGKQHNLTNAIAGSSGIQYHRAINEITSLANSTEGAGAIVAKYPGLQGIAKYIVPQDGGKVTALDVHNVFVQTAWDKDFMTAYSTMGQAMVPSRTVLRAAISKTADTLRQTDGNDVLYLKANQPNFFFPKKTNAASMVDVTDPATGQVTQTIQASPDKTWNMPVALRPLSTDAWKAAIAGKIRTFSGYMPYAIDTNLNELSTTRFDPNDPGSAQAVYRIARFAMGDKMAQQKTAEFVNGDINTKKAVYAGMVHEMVKAAGIVDDPVFVRDTMDGIAMHIQGPLARTNYGVGFEKGNDASLAKTATGDARQAAFMDQAGKFAIPDFREIKTAMRNQSAYGKLYGSIDNFGARYTDHIFKPLALLTGGFGLRIAASELIPQIFRFGTLAVAKAKIADSAAKMNMKLIPGETDAIFHNASLALADGTDAKTYIAQKAAEAEGKVAAIRKTGVKGLNKLASEDDLSLASEIAIATKGHMATGATLTGHGIPAEQQEFVRQVTELIGLDGKKKLINPTGGYSHYTSGDPHFDIHYYGELAKSVITTSRKQILTDALDEMKKGVPVEDAWATAQNKDLARILKKEYDPASPTFMGKDLPPGQDLYAPERSKIASYSNEKASEFAARRVDIMRNLFTGAEGNTNTELMQMIADGQKPSLQYLRDLDFKLKPTAVAGQEYDILPGPNLLNRITQFGFGKVIDPIVNNLSRQPLFFNHVKNEISSMNDAVGKGFLTHEEALRIAMTRATYAMMPQIHNIALRTQFAVLMRNYLPFYFAQEQAVRRAGILVSSNPAAFHQYQLVQQGLNDPGFIETDSLGNKHMTLPMIGALGASFLTGASALGLPVVGGLPVTATGNMQSLRTVIPESTMPGVSPFVAVSLNALGALDPTLDREIKKTIGGASYNRSLIDQLIPNSPMRNAFKALNANENESSFYNAMISSIASAQFHHQMPLSDSSPLEKQAFLDRIKNNARSILWMKALVSTWSPLSPNLSQEDLGLRDEFYNLMKQKSAVTGKLITFPEALGEFLTKHGDSAISYTLARTEAAVPGAMMPYTDEAINWIENNKALLNSKNATGAAFLVPQVTSLSGDAQAIHDEILKMHLRSQKTPDEFLKAVYVAAGNNYIYSQKPAHDKAMADLKKNGQSQVAERAAWSGFVQNYGQMNPIWEADYSSPVRTQNAVHAVEQLQNIFVSKNPPQTEQAHLVEGLLRDWVNHAQAIQRYSTSYGQQAVNAEKDNWSTYLDNLIQSKPQLNSVINSVFRRLA